MWGTSMRIEQSAVIHGGPDRVWALLSSPEAWNLRPDAPLMFALPEAPALRLYVGATRRGTGAALLEISDEVPEAMVRLRTLPTGRQEFTLSVAAGRRGTAKATVRVKEIVPRQQLIDFELARRNYINKWLSAIRAVIEGRAQWPDAGMPAKLQQTCLVRPPIRDWWCASASASALITAAPGTVWDAVQSPETARSLGPSPAIYSGYVPGTPRGEAGEMQYFVSRGTDGQLRAAVVVVSEISAQRSALTHLLGPMLFEQHYLLTPESESGPTRLDLTCRRSAAPKPADAAEAARSRMAEALQAEVNDYKSLIETGSGGASAAAPVGEAG
jgi:hypothetical protein